MKQLNLFHFDITTNGNYGDNLLFTMVRNTFEAYAGGAAFAVRGHAPLREPISWHTIDVINSTADAVVIGGGGLFLRDTARNAASGWQWNIDREKLAAIKVPLIIFAVGNNRFIDQADFEPIFRDHLAQTVDQSIFVGLRNHGSIETIKPYLRDDLAAKITYQPCPTTLSRVLYPNRVPGQQPDKTIATHLIIGKRQRPAGFDADLIYDRMAQVLQRLRDEDWRVLSAPFARADEGFAALLEQRGLVDERVQLHGPNAGLFDGIDLFAHTPFVLGGRGHGQMVPFGVGSLPFSAYIHHKLGYFADDIGRPNWVQDPRTEGFVEAMHREIVAAHETFDEHQRHLAEVQQRLAGVTVQNLSAIYRALGGEPTQDARLEPFDPRAQGEIARTFALENRMAELSKKVRDHTASAERAAAGEHAARQVQAEAERRAERAEQTLTDTVERRRANEPKTIQDRIRRDAGRARRRARSLLARVRG